MKVKYLIATLTASLLWSAALTGQNPPNSTQIRVIELGLRGFMPSRLLWPVAGRHWIFVRNTTRAQPLVLHFDTSVGAKLKEVQLTPKNPHWRELIELPPGTYVLTEASHPAWKAVIVVNAGR